MREMRERMSKNEREYKKLRENEKRLLAISTHPHDVRNNAAPTSRVHIYESSCNTKHNTTHEHDMHDDICIHICICTSI
jgi:hypothetical protein